MMRLTKDLADLLGQPLDLGPSAKEHPPRSKEGPRGQELLLAHPGSSRRFLPGPDGSGARVL